MRNYSSSIVRFQIFSFILCRGKINCHRAKIIFHCQLQSTVYTCNFHIDKAKNSKHLIKLRFGKKSLQSATVVPVTPFKILKLLKAERSTHWDELLAVIEQRISMICQTELSGLTGDTSSWELSNCFTSDRSENSLAIRSPKRLCT